MELRLKLDPYLVLIFSLKIIHHLPFFNVSVTNLFQGKAKAKELTARYISKLQA